MTSFAVRRRIRSKAELFLEVTIDYLFALTVSFIIVPRTGQFAGVKANSFSVSWTPPADSGPIGSYRVKALPQDNPSAGAVTCNYASGENARCEGLQGNTLYKATIEAWCAEYGAPAEYGAALTTNQQLTQIDSKAFFFRDANTIYK